MRAATPVQLSFLLRVARASFLMSGVAVMAVPHNSQHAALQSWGLRSLRLQWPWLHAVQSSCFKIWSSWSMWIAWLAPDARLCHSRGFSPRHKLNICYSLTLKQIIILFLLSFYQVFSIIKLHDNLSITNTFLSTYSRKVPAGRTFNPQYWTGNTLTSHKNNYNKTSHGWVQQQRS